PGQRDHVAIALELFGLDVEVHVSSPRARVWSAVFPRRESLTLRLRAERLDLLLRVGRARVIRGELQEALVGADCDLRVLGGLCGTRERERVCGIRRFVERDDA